MNDVSQIDPSKVAGGLHKFAGQYVVLSTKNEVVGSGHTYREATQKAKGRQDVVLFTVPEADMGLAPSLSA